MPESVSVPMSILHDNRLSREDIRVYAGLVQLSQGGTACTCTEADLQLASSTGDVYRHTEKLRNCGHIVFEKNPTGALITYTLASTSLGVKVSSFQTEFLEYSTGVHTKKTQAGFTTAFREFIRVEGDRPLGAIGIREIEHFLSVKKAEASDFTARKYYIALRSAFEKAIQWELIKENPFTKVKKPKVREVLPAFFTESDFRLFLSATESNDFRDLCLTGILTGLRLGELLSLRWADVDFNGKTILIHNSDSFTTKSKRSRVVPMSEGLSATLLERKNYVRSESEIVFPNKYGRALSETVVERKFKRIVRRTGLDDRLHFHSLRHSFASSLVESGVSLYAVQKLLGHSSSRTTEIYSHLLPTQLHKEVNALSARFSLT